jgi:hypothetical protein
MKLRSLCRGFALLLFLRPPTAPAVEALTTTVEEVNVKNRIEDKEKTKEDLTKKLKNSERKLDQLENVPGVREALRDSYAVLPSTEGLSAEAIRSVEEYPAAAAEVFADQSKLADAEAQLEKVKHELKVIPISANVQINSGSSASAVVPGIDASGSFPISNSLDCQILLSIKPDPPAGTSADVAQSIRMSTGVLSANFGVNYNYFWKGDDKPQGPLGVEARVGLPVAYQRASSTDAPASGQSSTSSKDFGLLSPEIKVSVWLKYVLLGYKYVYYFAFGNPNAVYEELNRTGSQKIYLATKLQALSGSDKTPFYLEANYTSGKNGFSGGAFSFAVSKSLSWDPR